MTGEPNAAVVAAAKLKVAMAERFGLGVSAQDVALAQAHGALPDVAPPQSRRAARVAEQFPPPDLREQPDLHRQREQAAPYPPPLQRVNVYGRAVARGPAYFAPPSAYHGETAEIEGVGLLETWFQGSLGDRDLSVRDPKQCGDDVLELQELLRRVPHTSDERREFVAGVYDEALHAVASRLLRALSLPPEMWPIGLSSAYVLAAVRGSAEQGGLVDPGRSEVVDLPHMADRPVIDLTGEQRTVAARDATGR